MRLVDLRPTSLLAAVATLVVTGCTVVPERTDESAAAGTPPVVQSAAPATPTAPIAPAPTAPAQASPPVAASSSTPATPPSPPAIAAADPTMKRVDPPVAAPVPPPPPGPPSPLQRELGDLVHHVLPEGVVVILGGDQLGEGGAPRLSPQAVEALDRIVAVLKRDADRRAAIVAFHQSPGSRDYNIALSERRANAVRQYLVDQGIRPHRVAVRPTGGVRPVAAGAVPEITEPERRVEIVIGRLPATTRVR